MAYILLMQDIVDVAWKEEVQEDQVVIKAWPLSCSLR